MPDFARRTKGFAIFVATILATQAGAQDIVGPVPDSVQRTFEMPGHYGLMHVVANAGGTPAPFSTDGCSGGLSAGWALLSDVVPGFSQTYEAEPPWESCCVTHDRAYHAIQGAEDVEQSYTARLTADLALRACVSATGAADDPMPLPYTQLADAMFNAVRLGGGPCSGLPWRWGYGFAQCVPEFP